MKKKDIKKVNKMTGDYDDWLSEHLQKKKAACAHIQVALENYQKDMDNRSLLLAIKDVAHAKGGISWLAKKTDLNREHLYYLLSGKGNPRLDTMMHILKAFGFKLMVTTI